jgi:DNA (cytosine-5)-methyltransferase 1
MGFDAEWGVLSAADVGANHLRERIWIVGKNTQQSRFFSHTEHNRDGWGKQQSQSIKEKNGNLANSSSIGQQGQGKYEQSLNSTKVENWETNYAESIGRPKFWAIEPNVGRVANGVAARVDRLKAIGNGQVPLCAATAWRLLNERLRS